MNIIDRVNFQYVIDLLSKRIGDLESELEKAKEQLNILLNGQGTVTRRRKRGGGRSRDPKFQELEKLILEVIDNQQMRTGNIVKRINTMKPNEFSYDDVRRTLGRMSELDNPKKGSWKKKESNVT